MKSTLNCEYFEKKDQSHSLSIIASMKSTLNSEYFEKKDQSQSLTINEIIDCETGSYWNV